MIALTKVYRVEREEEEDRIMYTTLPAIEPWNEKPTGTYTLEKLVELARDPDTREHAEMNGTQWRELIQELMNDGL